MWFVKITRHGYGSVLNQFETKHEAEAYRDVLNTQYQTDEYYVEPFRAGW